MARIQVLNTKGAAKRLGCSESWIHRLVATGKLKAYVYDDDGRLVERKPEERISTRMWRAMGTWRWLRYPHACARRELS